MIDHDQLFKELLSTFFIEFLALFFPDLRAYLDEDCIEFLDKEFFTDLLTGERREADIVVKAKFSNQDSFFIINLENQGRPGADFGERLFFYFVYLRQKYHLPVYPIVVFYHNSPLKQQPEAFRIDFPDRQVLEFRYGVVQLNRLHWRDFVTHKNPVASALMAKMKIAPPERPFVKLECLRLMTGLKLNKAKMRLISGFVDSYLKLTAQEQEIFEQEVVKIEPRRRKRVMELTTSWKKEGMKEGVVIGEKRGMEKGEKLGKQREAVKLVLIMLKQRFGNLSEDVRTRVAHLSLHQLENLTKAVFDLGDVEALISWLDKVAAKSL